MIIAIRPSMNPDDYNTIMNIPERTWPDEPVLAKRFPKVSPAIDVPALHRDIISFVLRQLGETADDYMYLIAPWGHVNVALFNTSAGHESEIYNAASNARETLRLPGQSFFEESSWSYFQKERQTCEEQSEKNP